MRLSLSPMMPLSGVRSYQHTTRAQHQIPRALRPDTAARGPKQHARSKEDRSAPRATPPPKTAPACGTLRGFASFGNAAR
eukprot:1557612-Rhodomonas_salina.1